VYTVTPTSLTQAPGSPMSVNAGDMVVVSNTQFCAPPTTNGVNVCSPAEGSTVTSPFTVSAGAYISGGIYRFELWNGSTNSVKLLSEDNGIMTGTVSLAPGDYDLIFDARNTAGQHYYKLQKVTVK